MRRIPTTGLWLLCCAVLLTSCAETKVARQIERLPPPAIDPSILLPCLEPTAPGPAATQRDAALVITDLREALAACNADKAALGRMLRTTPQK